MFKNILVFLDGGEESLQGLTAAVHLARLAEGRIRGLFVKKIELLELGLLPLAPDMGAAPPVLLDPELLASLEAEKDKTAQRLAELFAATVGPLADGLQVVRGELVEELVQASRTADVVIMGRNRLATQPTTDWISDVTRQVLKRSLAPVLLPGSHPQDLLQGPFLLAYDASPAANRTLRQLIRLAALAQAAVSVLAVGPPDSTSPWLEEASSYLKPYNLTFSLEALEGKASEVIQTFVAQRQFSLIGLGAHGHFRLRDLVLGTTADKMLRHMPQAFLVCSG
ncbi:MAG: universal stress protein [Deltaproteobacteria bacterium]|nr:universal stress protein [Deltaproteobacteria bacterium]